ncbi:MAG TPA: YdcH family protein [Acetobacteraceae bacterium]|nr:YdcH family protein [Acetobacteraceae bacterium]
MSLDTHLDQLRERHAALEARIADEDHRPRPDSEALNRLKLEKLHLKEEMERLRSRAS